MGALLLQPSVGSPMGWLGILAQFTASACLVVAGIHWGREAPPVPRQGGAPQGVDRRLSYGLAAVFVFAAAVLRLVLIPGLGNVAPFSHFFPAVLLAGLYGGWGPGCLAIVLSLLCGQYLWVPPETSLVPSTLEDTVAALMFAITSGLLLTLLLLIQKARARELVLVYEWREMEREGRQARELQLRETRYRTLFDSVDQGICVCELQPGGVAVIDFNPGFARMMGVTPGDDAGTVLDGLPGLERSRLDRYTAIATEGRCDRFETVSARTGRSFEVRATPLEAPARVVLLFADITARRAEAERQRLAAERDRYALELGHLM
jgi:PAS domain S-box-containing protein